MKQFVFANLLIASTNAFVAIPNSFNLKSGSSRIITDSSFVVAVSVSDETVESVVEDTDVVAAVETMKEEISSPIAAVETVKEEVSTPAAVVLSERKKKIAAVSQLPETKQKITKKKINKHASGVFSPIVLFSKSVLGDENLKKFRQKVINAHSDVIANFVDTSSTEFGEAVLRTLFNMADKDGNGTICEKELEDALKSLGFTWVNEKQAKIMFKRTDKDKSGEIDMEEWMAAAPMTLRVNLIKLAKKNGEDMGLLA